MGNRITWEFGSGDPNPVSMVVHNPNNNSLLNGPFFIAEYVDVSSQVS